MEKDKGDNIINSMNLSQSDMNIDSSSSNSSAGDNAYASAV